MNSVQFKSKYLYCKCPRGALNLKSFLLSKLDIFCVILWDSCGKLFHNCKVFSDLYISNDQLSIFLLGISRKQCLLIKNKLLFTYSLDIFPAVHASPLAFISTKELCMMKGKYLPMENMLTNEMMHSSYCI